MFKKILSLVTIILVLLVGVGIFRTPVDCKDLTKDATAVQECNEMLLQRGKGGKVTMWDVTMSAAQDMNLWILLMLVPAQILMYYAAGKVYFSFLHERQGLKMSEKNLMRIALEINFVNHALPSAGASGLGYLIWRLKNYRVSAGQVSFVHMLRFIFSFLIDVGLTVICVIAVLLMVVVRPDGWWAIVTAVLVASAVVVLILGVWLIIKDEARIDRFSKWASRRINLLMRHFNGRSKKELLNERRTNKFFSDLRNDYMVVRRDKKAMLKPIIWAGVYTILETGSYWVVGAALGFPGILPQVFIAGNVASVVGTVLVTPGGLGGYEAVMIAMMYATGVDFTIAVITVIVTRITIMLGTFITGWGFYQQALVSRRDKFDAKKHYVSN